MGAGGFPSTALDMNPTDRYLMFFKGTEVKGQVHIFGGNHVNPFWADYKLIYSSFHELEIRN